jgi:SPP1 gp7 family putative phage head morphogenesis protein
MKKTFDDPDQAEREYIRLLSGFVRSLRTDINQIVKPRLSAIRSEFADETRMDGWADTLATVMQELALLAVGRVNRVTAALPSMYNLIARHNDRQFRMVVRANTGLTVPEARLPTAPNPRPGVFTPVSVATRRGSLAVDLFSTEPYLDPLYRGWINENTSLIKSIPEQYHKQVEGVLSRGIMSGQSVKTLSAELEKQFDITERRARLIATDQTLKAHSSLTEYRLKSVGVKEYTWETVNDSRVRPEHQDRQGNVYSWDKPPAGGQHPGQEIRCRCRASAVWPDGD